MIAMITMASMAVILLHVVGCGDDGPGGPVCGNGICEEGENSYNCPEDCPGPYCGDGVCDPEESAATCPEDCYCGNGTLERRDGEECDGHDLGGKTCLDFGCDGGILSCRPNCRFDLTNCIGCEPMCGDGRVDGDEMCDCGLDPDNLPPGCDAINGEGNCTLDCTLLHWCGDGVVDYDLGEECDCGDDPTSLPAGCSAPNGGPECTEYCTIPNICRAEIRQRCDPDDVYACCPDDWGRETECSTILTTPYCLLPCNDIQDCNFNDRCASGGYCVNVYCGPLFPGGAEINGDCEVPGGGPGICIPVGPAAENVGICIEHGTGMHGESCDDVFSLENSNQPRMMDFDRCNSGYCSGGSCLAFCDSNYSYDHGETCPSGSNCLGFSYFYRENPLDPYDNHLDGRRWAEVGLCLDQNLDASVGAYGCDLVTGELIWDRTNTCGDLGTGLICEPFVIPEWYDDFLNEEGVETLGSLIGACRQPEYPEHPVFRNLWDDCEPNGPDVCPSGSRCLFEASSGYKCLPFCDTQNDGCPSIGGLPSNVFCESLSVWETAAETSRSRLGACVCPSAGCE